jgi:hypothetical protein
MEISKDNSVFSTIDKQYSMKSEDSLWFIQFSNDSAWTEAEYNRFTNVMNSLDYNENIEAENLEVHLDESVLNISGISNISKYCLTDDYRKLNVSWFKERILDQSIVDDLIDSKLTFKLLSKTSSQEPANWKDNRKFFKVSKRISYTDSKTKVKYVVNITKYKDEEIQNMYYSFRSSGILKTSQRYEFYIDVSETNKDNIIQSIIQMEQTLYMSTYILSKQQQQKVVDEYYNLVKDDIFVRSFNKNHMKPPLLTPKPVTLEKVNLLNPEDYGVVSILSEYTVTEKADGERLLMFINKQGKVFIINNTYRVVDTGLQAAKELYNSLIDGEYIECHKRKDSASNSLYAAFDIYYYGGKNITQFPLIDDKGNNSRNHYLLETAKFIKATKHSMDYIVKHHLYSKEILKDCKKILSPNNNYLYDIDGLIFTPAKLPLYSYYANKPVQITDNVKWDRVFKWKPPEQNTIDFLVKEGNTIMKDGQKYKEMLLYVGYNSSQWENYTIDEALKIHYDKEYRNNMKDKKTLYIPKLFKPSIYYTPGVEKCFVKVNSNGETRCENGDKFETDNIVEFKYVLDQSIPVSQRWVPVRIREDKTRVYKKGELSKTANDFGVAINIWRSIHNPVTESIITGNEPILNMDVPDADNERLLETDDIYYARNIPREALLSYNMLQFHNHGIKKMLYAKPKHKGSLLELACGEAGDMPRWLDNGYKFVLGIDLVKNNIYGPRSGAYSRMINRKFQILRKLNTDKVVYTDMAFAVGDCAKSILSGACSISVNDQESANLLKLVFNKKKGNIQKHYTHIASQGANGFDACSCMFSIHYFFKSEETLDGFLNNVSGLLKKGGIFFCTFMDGKSIEDALEAAGGDIIEGKELSSSSYDGIPIWAIIRRFSHDKSSSYNKKIDVFIESTNRFIPEYIVSYELLVEKCKAYNLILEESEMFSATFNKLKAEIPDDDNVKDNLQKNILDFDKDPVQKQFSFFNRWCVFKMI